MNNIAVRYIPTKHGIVRVEWCDERNCAAIYLGDFEPKDFPNGNLPAFCEAFGDGFHDLARVLAMDQITQAVYFNNVNAIRQFAREGRLEKATCLPLDGAVCDGNKPIAKLLIQHGCPISPFSFSEIQKRGWNDLLKP